MSVDDQSLHQTSDRLLVGIAGGSCSGKGYLCEQLRSQFSDGECLTISLDDYYRDLSNVAAQDRHLRNFDCPKAIDYRLLSQHLRDICTVSFVKIPIYDFHTHTRSGYTHTRLDSIRIILVEGLFCLYWSQVRDLFSVKVFIELEQDHCLKRRLRRDVDTRGRIPRDVESQFHSVVSPMYAHYVESTRRYADLTLRGDEPVQAMASQVLAAINTMAA